MSDITQEIETKHPNISIMKVKKDITQFKCSVCGWTVHDYPNKILEHGCRICKEKNTLNEKLMNI